MSQHFQRFLEIATAQNKKCFPSSSQNLLIISPTELTTIADRINVETKGEPSGPGFEDGGTFSIREPLGYRVSTIRGKVR